VPYRIPAIPYSNRTLALVRVTHVAEQNYFVVLAECFPGN